MFRRNKNEFAELASLPVFEGLGKSDLKRASELGEFVSYEPGDVVIDEGGFSHHFFVVVDGSVEVTHAETPLATVSAGNVLGEAALLDWWTPPKDQRADFESGRRTATVTASADRSVKMFVLDQRAFEELRETAPAVALRLIDAVRHQSRHGRSSSPDGGS